MNDLRYAALAAGVGRRERRGGIAAPAALVIMALLALGGCGSQGGGGNAAPAAFTMDVAVAGEKLFQELAFRDRLEELAPTVVYTLLGINENDVSAQKNYFSSGATAEEIIVFQARDQEALGALKAVLEARVKEQMEIYASYAPEEVEYLKGAVLKEKGDYIVFCVAADADAASRLVGEVLK